MGEDRRFYFLEMNTRLQVEHPVTEFVTGLDLVEQMIRVAAGEKLGFGQSDVTLNGWAIESRLYAEDPSRNFMPSIGRLNRYRPPAEGMTGATSVRIDAGVGEDSEISVYFDPLIAKLVTHGPDRAAAVEAMAGALDRFVIDGIAHNQAFLSAIMAHRRWQEGQLSTSFIAEEYPGGFAEAVPDPRGARASRHGGARHRTAPPPQVPQPRRPPERGGRQMAARLGGRHRRRAHSTPCRVTRGAEYRQHRARWRQAGSRALRLAAGRCIVGGRDRRQADRRAGARRERQRASVQPRGGDDGARDDAARGRTRRADAKKGARQLRASSFGARCRGW